MFVLQHRAYILTGREREGSPDLALASPPIRCLGIALEEPWNSIWNSLSSDSKSANNVNSFKHKIKENFFQNIQREEGDIYVYY